MVAQGAYATGVARYAQSLQAGLAAQGVDAHLVALRRRELRVAGREMGGLVSLWAARAASRRPDADVVHATDPAVATRGADVVTVHDLVVETHPQWYQRTAGERLDWSLARRLSKRVPWIVTVSEATRQDVLARWQVDPERVVAVPSGIDHATFRPLPDPPASPLLAEGKANLVYLGDDNPRKNLLLAVKAVADLGRPARLIRLGPSRFPDVHRRYQDEARKRGVDLVEPGFVDDAQIVPLLNRADAFLWPTLAEGFGFPPLEAMACGCPVVATDIPVNREILGDEARYHANEPRAAAEAIRSALESPPDKARLVAHARRFTWDAAARATNAVYARAREARR